MRKTSIFVQPCCDHLPFLAPVLYIVPSRSELLKDNPISLPHDLFPRHSDTNPTPPPAPLPVSSSIYFTMEGKQLTTFVVTLVCVIISTITVSLRSIVRVSINGFGVDDGLMVVGQVISLVLSCSTTTNIHLASLLWCMCCSPVRMQVRVWCQGRVPHS